LNVYYRFGFVLLLRASGRTVLPKPHCVFSNSYYSSHAAGSGSACSFCRKLHNTALCADDGTALMSVYLTRIFRLLLLIRFVAPMICLDKFCSSWVIVLNAFVFHTIPCDI
jgi:hypothetical protein